MGNHSRICLPDDTRLNVKNTLPENLRDFKAIMLFSNATSQLSGRDVDRIVNFVYQGGGLYTGAENWPLQAESNQLTDCIYKKKSFGNFNQSIAETNIISGNLNLDKSAEIPAGKTTVAFPMDHRLHVEAWVDDQPLILTGNLNLGKIIIDGGYSRFIVISVHKRQTTFFMNLSLTFLKTNLILCILNTHYSLCHDRTAEVFT